MGLVLDQTSAAWGTVIALSLTLENIGYCVSIIALEGMQVKRKLREGQTIGKLSESGFTGLGDFRDKKRDGRLGADFIQNCVSQHLPPQIMEKEVILTKRVEVQIVQEYNRALC